MRYLIMLVLRKDWINLVQSQLNSLDSSEILVFKTLKEDRSVYINKIGNTIKYRLKTPKWTSSGYFIVLSLPLLYKIFILYSRICLRYGYPLGGLEYTCSYILELKTNTEFTVL